MRLSLLRRVMGLTLTALILAAHLPLPAAGGITSTMACCGPKACCTPEPACASASGACTTHSDHAGAPIALALPTLVAGNCADPTPRVVPVSFDPVTPPSANAFGPAATIAVLSVATAPTAPARDLTPSVPPPRA